MTEVVKAAIEKLAEEYAEKNDGNFEYSVKWAEVADIFRDGAEALDKIYNDRIYNEDATYWQGMFSRADGRANYWAIRYRDLKEEYEALNKAAYDMSLIK